MDGVVRVRSLVWFAMGMVTMLVAALVVTNASGVDAAPGDSDTTFVPIAPCRLMDTRPASKVGERGAPFGTNDTYTVAAHGGNGDCTIPSEAVGLSLNVTALDATLPTFLTVWADGVRPEASSLNPAPGQPPAPNAVSTPLSGSGSFKIFNKQGSVNVIVDVNGYHTKSSLADLEAAKPFAAMDHGDHNPALEIAWEPTAYQSLTVAAPVAGQVTVNYNALVGHSNVSGRISCAVHETDQIPAVHNQSYPSLQTKSGQGQEGISGTRMFDIAAGVTTSYSFACVNEAQIGASLGSATLTAIFTPAP